jgi:phosphohistidine phosphatase SixA
MKETENKLKIEEKTPKQMVHLFDDYYMDADNYNYILKKAVVRKTKKTNEEYESTQVLGYFPDMKSLVHSLIKNEHRQAVSSGSIKDLEQAINRLNQLTERIQSLVLV